MNKDNYYAEYYYWQDDKGVNHIYSAYETVSDTEFKVNGGRPDMSECLDAITDQMEADGFISIDDGSHLHHPECVKTSQSYQCTEQEFKQRLLTEHRRLPDLYRVPVAELVDPA